MTTAPINATQPDGRNAVGIESSAWLGGVYFHGPRWYAPSQYRTGTLHRGPRARFIGVGLTREQAISDLHDQEMTAGYEPSSLPNVSGQRPEQLARSVRSTIRDSCGGSL